MGLYNSYLLLLLMGSVYTGRLGQSSDYGGSKLLLKDEWVSTLNPLLG